MAGRWARCRPGIDRQEILNNARPLLWYVVHEAVLRNLTGGPAVMAPQLDHLLELIAARRIVLQVLPLGGECAEVADHDGHVLVRDTKAHDHGPVHRYTPAQWQTLITIIKTKKIKP